MLRLLGVEIKTYCAAGCKEVYNVVIKLSNMVTDVQLHIFIPQARTVLSHMHTKHRAHYSYNESEREIRNRDKGRQIRPIHVWVAWVKSDCIAMETE